MIRDYDWDVGTSHIIDWYMHREVQGITVHFRAQPALPLQRIGRYLDGEEEREGLYR
jgi:hypothetical protein